MARITKPLTNTEVKFAKSKDKEYSLSDGQGLSLRVKPNGSKLWLFNYYHPITKKRNNLSFGIYPEVSISDARNLRLSARELLSKDIDPKEKRQAELTEKKFQANNTLNTIAENWFIIKKTTVTDNTANRIWRMLEKHIFPSLAARPISDITAPEVIAILNPLAAQGTLETTSKIIRHLNEIMVFSVNTGVIHHNPLAGIKAAFANPVVKHMPTLKPKELPELMKALNHANIKRVTRYLIEWQLHTMVRPSEASGAKWKEIDLKNKLWIIPAERMKKNRPHTVPLTIQTLNLLEALKAISGHREFIFPSDRDPNKPSNSETANRAIQRMGFKGRLVAHGLRALASTTLNEQVFNSDVIEAALSHVSGNEVRRAYNHAEYLQPRFKMMSWWSDHIDEAATGNMSLTASFKTLKLVNQ